MNINKIAVTALSVAALITSACALMSSEQSDQMKPELPIMQSFSATPRFENTVEIFGQKLDISRYDLHERYERELTNMCYTHNSTIQTIKRANRYFPIICPILAEEGMPEDLIYLACIESSLNTRALSPAGAAGIWQFTADTGRQFGLEINSEVDERYNIEKATRAACKFLRQAYQKFGDWNTVAASYNGGQAGTSRKLAAQKQTSALDLLLVEETSRYMFRIMAMKEILRDPYRYGFVLYSDQLYRPIRTDKVEVSGPIASMVDFAAQYGLSYYHLKEFNPWLRDDKLVNKSGKTYIIEIPQKADMYYGTGPFEIYNNAWVVDK